MKIGLEKEFFVLKDGMPIVAPNLLEPDESGLLAEARGQAFSNPAEAVYSLMANVHKLQKNAEKENVSLSDVPIMKISRDTKIEARRKFAKPALHYQNLYGHKYHRNSLSEQTAGIHISFTSGETKSVKVDDKYVPVDYNGLFDYVKMFKALDKAFEQEIKESKRRPGFYEIKGDGRIEYRSLPANADLNKVISVLEEVTKNK